MNGVADYHGYGSTCFTWNALEIPGWHEMDNMEKRESILYLLRQKDMSKIKVLLYHDRKVFDRSQVILSPVYTFVSYFRTLNNLQVLSWTIWIMVIGIMRRFFLKRNKIQHLKIGTLQIMEFLAISSGIFILLLGNYLLKQSKPLADYNDIYAEYGTQMLWAGRILLIYTLILLLFDFWNYRIAKNKI